MVPLRIRCSCDAFRFQHDYILELLWREMLRIPTWSKEHYALQGVGSDCLRLWANFTFGQCIKVLRYSHSLHGIPQYPWGGAVVAENQT